MTPTPSPTIAKQKRIGINDAIKSMGNMFALIIIAIFIFQIGVKIGEAKYTPLFQRICTEGLRSNYLTFESANETNIICIADKIKLGNEPEPKKGYISQNEITPNIVTVIMK